MITITDHGLDIGKVYMGTDAHKRTVQSVEYHFGNIQVKVFDSFWGKVEWIPQPEWNTFNPASKIARKL